MNSHRVPKRSHSGVQRALDIWCMMGVKVAKERVKYYTTSMFIQFSASSKLFDKCGKFP